MAGFILGVAAGLLLAIPAVVIAGRRVARRVRRLEQRTRAAERLAELGTLTGGLAHEIKNPLSTISLNVQLLQEDLTDLTRNAPPGSLPEDRLHRLQRRFDSLNRETQRLREILEDFLRFAGRVKLDRVPSDVNALIEELVDFFTPQAQVAGVRLRTQLVQPAAVLSVDPGLLKQAMLNLMINACQAMSDSRRAHQPNGGAGELIIRTERHDDRAGRDLHIHITDTGPGMPPDVLEKVFQPYFSTKRGGTGLGLPVSRRIVEEHGGTITVHSELGRGTDFLITLPFPTHKPSSPRT